MAGVSWFDSQLAPITFKITSETHSLTAPNQGRLCVSEQSQYAKTRQHRAELVIWMLIAD